MSRLYAVAFERSPNFLGFRAEHGPHCNRITPDELKRDDGEKVVLSLAPKAPSATAAPAAGLKLNPLKANPLKLAANPLKANPLKAANPLKRANQTKQPAPSAGEAESVVGKKREMTAAERLMVEDQERKRRRMERETA